MKVNELMVGDLVYVHEPECKGHRIDAIDELDGQVGADGEVYDECDIRPIPFTEEILVKNGWRKESITIDGDYANWHGEIPICQEEDEFNYERIELTYVHQLQHLLRLCDIEKEIEL